MYEQSNYISKHNDVKMQRRTSFENWIKRHIIPKYSILHTIQTLYAFIGEIILLKLKCLKSYLDLSIWVLL